MLFLRVLISWIEGDQTQWRSSTVPPRIRWTTDGGLAGRLDARKIPPSVFFFLLLCFPPKAGTDGQTLWGESRPSIAKFWRKSHLLRNPFQHQLFLSKDIPKTPANIQCMCQRRWPRDALVSFLFHSKSIAKHPSFAIVVKG